VRNAGLVVLFVVTVFGDPLDDDNVTKLKHA
jgi:hypothetical protein